jgi:hypothetical protein
MKKINFLVIAVLLALQAGFTQNPYSIIEFDSTIGSIRDVIKLSETELIIVGNKKHVAGQPSQIYIANINLNGEIIWKKEHLGGIPPFTNGNCLCIKADGNYYIAMQMNSSGLLLELNPSGDSVWSFSSSAPGLLSSKFRMINEIPGNGFVFTNLIYDPDQMGSIGHSYYYIVPLRKLAQIH